ncbi:MAG: thioredoxin domain-containing protein [Nitrospira sp.]|nr:thioredoxin domain-containing protein [Nitrospira sp.]
MTTREPAPAPRAQPVSEQDHTLRPTIADVTLVEFGNVEYPYSREGTKVARLLYDRFKGQLRFVLRPFPLPKHPHARYASMVSNAASAQGKFWEMVETMFLNQDSAFY